MSRSRKAHLFAPCFEKSGIHVENLRVNFGTEEVLGPINLVVKRQGITALIGPNGAGKSTLLRTMGRLLGPRVGTVTVAGCDVHATDSRTLSRVISILQQHPSVVSRLTVREIVTLGRFPYSRGKITAEDKNVITESLRFLSLNEIAHRPLENLSGGQRQRAFVAMVLAQNTDFILLDEPLSGLDMGHAVKLMAQIRAASQELGKTIVWVEHDVNTAAAFADRMIALAGGRIVANGIPAEVMNPAVLTELYDTPVNVFRNQGKFFADFYSCS